METINKQNYIIKQLSGKPFSCLVLPLTQDSLYDYFPIVQKEKLIKKNKGTVLFDNVFFTGFSRNRYISFEFDKGIIDLSSAKVEKPNKEILCLSSQMLETKPLLLQNSILTKKQIANCKHTGNN